MKIRCTGCNRILENPNWNPQDTCKICGSNFIPNTPQFPVQNPNYHNPLPQSFPEIPHVYLGKNGFSTNPIQNNPQPQNNPMYPPQNVNSPVKKDKEVRTYDLYEKIRLYGFYICISLVIGYAVWRIIKLFIGG